MAVLNCSKLMSACLLWTARSMQTVCGIWPYIQLDDVVVVVDVLCTDWWWPSICRPARRDDRPASRLC